MNRKLRKHLTVESDILLFQSCDKPRIAHSLPAHGSTEPRDPESAEIPLFETAIAVRVPPCLHHGFVRLLKAPLAHATVAFVELDNLFVTPAAGESCFDSHEWVEKSMRLEVGENGSQSLVISLIDDKRPAEILLTLIFLHEEVIAAVSLHNEFSRTRFPDPLFCAAVGLLLHEI